MAEVLYHSARQAIVIFDRRDRHQVLEGTENKGVKIVRRGGIRTPGRSFSPYNGLSKRAVSGPVVWTQ
jgi:hypothetical protein